MNVACDNCGKAYLLPEGTLVPGVQVRIRCKACDHVFTVSAPASMPPPAAPAHEAVVESEEVDQEAAAPGLYSEREETPTARIDRSHQVARTAPMERVGPDGRVIADHSKDAPEALTSVPAASAKPSDPTAPGEITRHFIAQSGANRRNPPWKIALFVLGFVGLPVGVLYLLSTLKLVTVTVTNAQGEAVEQPFFSSSGVSGLRDLLTGAERERREKAEQVRVEKARRNEDAARAGVPRSTGLGSDERRGSATGTVAGGDPKMGGLAAFYAGNDQRKDAAPKLRPGDESAPPTAHAGGLDDSAAAKVVAQSQPAFQLCIENALHRNPNMKVGKVVMTVTIGKTGVVKGTTIAPKQHETSDWGGCLAERAKRMVFPPFEGDDEAELQVPLVVGVGF